MCIPLVAAALSSCISAGEPTPSRPDQAIHHALIRKRYELVCLGADDTDDSFEREMNRRYGQRYEAVLAALAAKYGEDALQEDFIDVVGCKTDGSEDRLRRAFELELRAWEAKLELR